MKPSIMTGLLAAALTGASLARPFGDGSLANPLRVDLVPSDDWWLRGGGVDLAPWPAHRPGPHGGSGKDRSKAKAARKARRITRRHK